MPRPLLALLMTVLSACSGEPAETPPPAPEPTPTVAPQADPGPTIEERRARYAARPAIELPAELPSAWARYAKALGGRIVEARHEVRSQPGRVSWRAVSLRVRVFGLDDAVRATVHGALAGLELPKLPPPAEAGDDFWRGEAITDGPVRWQVDIGRLVAPPGEPREQIVELSWRREPPDPAEMRECRKPPPVEAPSATPAWLERTTNKRTTRRRVAAAIERTAKEQIIELRMLFRNGLAHDEHLRHLAEAAQKAGFTRESGEGTRQRWADGSGARFDFEPDTGRDLRIGCVLAGPVLRITLTTPAG